MGVIFFFVSVKKMFGQMFLSDHAFSKRKKKPQVAFINNHFTIFRGTYFLPNIVFLPL